MTDSHDYADANEGVDSQDQAEATDDDAIGGPGSAVLSDEGEQDPIADRPRGIPFADSDVTDESLEDRLAQEYSRRDESRRTDAADERLEQIIELDDDDWGTDLDRD